MIKKEISQKTEEDEKEDTLSSLEEENHNKEDFSKPTSYTIKYTRSKDELSDLVLDTNFPKAKHCLFMIDFILIKNSESLLRVKCHEMSAIHFEDFYERIYTFDDMIEENRYFRALDSIEEIKESIDYVLSQNTKNKKKKFFVELDNNILNLHINLTYFDTMKEIVLHIPKKKLRDEEKIFLLPMLLKEIQEKMNVVEKENKNFKIQKKRNIFKIHNNKNNNNFAFDIINEEEKETEDENNKSLQHSLKNETTDTSINNSLELEEKKNKIKKKKKKKV
jgi:hypothetical protein